MPEIPIEMIKAGFQLSIDTINSKNKEISDLDMSIKAQQDAIAGYQNIIADSEARKISLQNDITDNKTSITMLASGTPPVLQDATDFLNAHPEYGINWTPTV